MKGITTHVLDTARGKPTANVAVRLEHCPPGGGWQEVANSETDGDGRIRHWPQAFPVLLGSYRLWFAVNQGFYTEIPIQFEVEDEQAHYHVPLLLSPYGYSTYRGS